MHSNDTQLRVRNNMYLHLSRSPVGSDDRVKFDETSGINRGLHIDENQVPLVLSRTNLICSPPAPADHCVRDLMMAGGTTGLHRVLTRHARP
jgi:hypothetical protein